MTEYDGIGGEEVVLMLSDAVAACDICDDDLGIFEHVNVDKFA